MNKTLLIGNSVNLMSTGYSWRILLKDLIEYVGKSSAIKYKMEKPFTLLYQEILIRSKRYTNFTEIELKQKIRNKLERISNNEFHKKYMGLGYQNILTTNYDYNLEKSVTSKFESANILRETKLNLFRRTKANNSYIWHIHGEMNKLNTITLGYDHYVSYLSEMHKYVSSTTTTRKKNVRFAFKVHGSIFDITGEPYSWIDLFIRDEVHIIGLSLDYNEIDLWWLLTLKEKLRNESSVIGETYFYYFVKSEDELDNVANREEAHQEKIKLSLLESYGVKTIAIRVFDNDYYTAHSKILRRLHNI